MRTLGIAVLATLLLIGGCMAGYKLAFPTYTYRYRMTVDVMVDGKVHSGSSVIEVRLKRQVQFAPNVPRVATEVRGEAVFVDLGTGRNVIAALASGPAGANSDYPEYIVPKHFGLSYGDKDLVKFPRLQGQWELAPDQLPTFVTFANLNNPKTAQLVPLDAFPRVFGPNVHLKDVRIEMTDDSVTRTILKRLPWLPHPGYLSGRFACGPPETQCLHGGSFSRS